LSAASGTPIWGDLAPFVPAVNANPLHLLIVNNVSQRICLQLSI
jgi:hypothetical protein